MKRTISIPVSLPDERFLNLMNQCALIFNAHIDWAIENETFNKNKAHIVVSTLVLKKALQRLLGNKLKNETKIINFQLFT